MAVKLPESIMLMGKKITVRKVVIEGRWGQFIPSQFLIEINPSVPDDMIEDVLMHELVHAVLEISGITNLMNIQHEEAICRALENLTSVYKLRPTPK